MDEGTVGKKISDCEAEGRRKLEMHRLRCLEDEKKMNKEGHRAKHKRQYRFGCKIFSPLYRYWAPHSVLHNGYRVYFPG
jgi:hypothetical protein